MVLATMEDTPENNSQATLSQRSNDRPLPNITDHPRAAAASADTRSPTATTLNPNPEQRSPPGVRVGTNDGARIPRTPATNWVSEHENTRWRNQTNNERTDRSPEPYHAAPHMAGENIQTHAPVFPAYTERRKPGELSSRESSDEEEDSEFVAATPPEKRGRIEM